MEVELKYIVPDYETFEQLLSLTHLGDYWLRPALDQRLTDHYYDTPERAVLRGGYALRLREDAERHEWIGTLKGLASTGEAASAEHEREEYESPVPPGAAPEAWPAGPARERALQLVGDRPTQEIVAIGQERHKRVLVAGEGDAQREVAELSLDVVSLPQNGHKQVTYELEIELRPEGARDDLKALGEALAGYQLAPQPKSKFERALEIVNGPAANPPPPSAEQPAMAEQPAEPEPQESRPAKKAAKSPGVRADETMAEAGRKVLRFHFDRMLDKEPAAREGADIEAVHDMRVATRRQRAALALFADHFKRKPARQLGGELKKLAHLLGGVRDLDVQLHAAQAYHDNLASPAATAIQPVLDAWSAERDNARAALLAHLDSPDYRAFKKAYKKFLASKEKAPAGQGDGLPQPSLVRQVLPGQLWDHYGEVRAFETVIAGASVPTLHALRIASKSLRYALEFFREVLEPALGAGKKNSIAFTIEAVVALQDHIGNLHDADVTIARLHAFLQDQEERAPRLSPETVMAVGQYMQTKQAELHRLHRSAGQPWRVVSGAKFRKILGKACSGL
jgi:CHAD domain-containing protein